MLLISPDTISEELETWGRRSLRNWKNSWDRLPQLHTLLKMDGMCFETDSALQSKSSESSALSEAERLEIKRESGREVSGSFCLASLSNIAAFVTKSVSKSDKRSEISMFWSSEFAVT